MTNLLDLPEEVIVNVVQHIFNSSRIQCTDGRPFDLWVGTIGESIDSYLEEWNSLRKLSVCNRYLFNLVGPFIHCPPLIVSPKHMSSFNRALGTYQGLSHRITAAYVDYIKLTLDELYMIFGLPNLHTLVIARLCDRVGDHYREDVFGTSSVKVLRLEDAIMSGLQNVLRIPQDLEELWYESNVEEWYYDGDLNQTSQAWNSFDSALEIVSFSLEKLVVSRTGYGLGLIPNDGQMLHLQHLQRLKSFSIDHCEALEKIKPVELWKRLPPNLEELEIQFGQSHLPYAWWEPIWLYKLLGTDVKATYAPRLESMRILYLEWIDAPSPAGTAESHYLDDPTGVKKWEQREFWRPPSGVLERFKKAGVSFCIFEDLDKKFRYIVDGDHTFEDPFDDIL